jgi:hypothetical protein
MMLANGGDAALDMIGVAPKENAVHEFAFPTVKHFNFPF